MSKSHSFTADQVQILREAFDIHLKRFREAKGKLSTDTSGDQQSGQSDAPSDASAQNNQTASRQNLNVSTVQDAQSTQGVLSPQNMQDLAPLLSNQDKDTLPLRDFLKLVREYLGLRIFTKDYILEYLKENYTEAFTHQIEIYDNILDIRISFDQMLEIIDSKFEKKQTKRQKLQQVFEEISLGSEYITPIEVAHLFKRFLGESLTSMEIKSLVSMMDTSHDVKISIEEWMVSMGKILSNGKDIK